MEVYPITRGAPGMSTADPNSCHGNVHLRRYTQTEGIAVDAHLGMDIQSYISKPHKQLSVFRYYFMPPTQKV